MAALLTIVATCLANDVEPQAYLTDILGRLDSTAKARIAVYGSATVAQALAAFENAGPQLDNPRSIARFLAVVAAMRKHAGEATTDDLETYSWVQRLIAVRQGHQLDDR